MSNNAMESKVKELMELKKMAQELEAEITTLEDEIKAVILLRRRSKQPQP